MENYRQYLPELKTTTLFQDMSDEQIIALLEAMQPAIERRKKGQVGIGEMEKGKFKMILRTDPAQPIAPRQFKWDMPQFGEPGMIMALASFAIQSSWITAAISRRTPRVRWKRSSVAQSSYRRSKTSGWIG